MCNEAFQLWVCAADYGTYRDVDEGTDCPREVLRGGQNDNQWISSGHPQPHTRQPWTGGLISSSNLHRIKTEQIQNMKPNSSSNCCPSQAHCRLCACMCLCSKCRHLFTSLAVKLFCFLVRKPKNREVSQVILCSRMRWGLLSGKSTQNMLLEKSVASSELRLVLGYVVNISEAAFKCSLTQLVTRNV